MPMTPRPAPGIADLAPYKGGDAGLDDNSNVARLASNESPLGPSPKAIEACENETGEIHRYPDGSATNLIDGLSLTQAVGGKPLAPERLIATAGSDELISLLVQAYVQPGEEVLFPAHSFLMYKLYAQIRGADAVETPALGQEQQFRPDIEALIERITPQTRLVFLASPSNPTGSYLRKDELERLLAGIPASVVLALDCAYYEYVEAPDYADPMPLVEERDNLIVLRTFSKFYALAGLRLGWGYGPPAIIEVLNRVRSPFNVNRAAQVAGVAALNDRAHAHANLEHNRREKAAFLQAARGLGYNVLDSEANFVLLLADQGEAPELDAFLRKRGLIVRRMEAYGLPDALRVSVGTSSEMERLVDALSAFKEGRK